MKTYVYIALDGLRTSPISEDAWLSAVQQCDELVVDRAGTAGARGSRVVRLKNDRRATVRLDRFGIASARDPSKDLISVMFKVASALDANVYSEHFNKYASTDDWLRRRTAHRRAFDKQRAFKGGQQQLLHFSLWCGLCTASVVSGFLLGYLYLVLIGKLV